MTNKNKEMRLQIAGQMVNSQESKVNLGISKELIILINALADELKCPVNTEFMENAVMLTPCCHRFNENSYTHEHPLIIGVGCHVCTVPSKGIYKDPHIRNISCQMKKIIDLLSKLELSSHS